MEGMEWSSLNKRYSRDGKEKDLSKAQDHRSQGKVRISLWHVHAGKQFEKD